MTSVPSSHRILKHKETQYSLQGCLRWTDQQSAPVHHHVFEGVNHLDMLRTEEPTTAIANIVAGLNKQLNRSGIAFSINEWASFF